MVLRSLTYCLLMVVCCSEFFADDPSAAEHRGLFRARTAEHLRQEIPELPNDVFERDWRNVVSSTSADMPGFHDQIPLSETVLVSGVVLGSDGLPAAGAEVWASGIFADVPHRERAVANERGEFELHLKPLTGEHERWIVRAFRDDEGACLQDYVTIRSVSDKAPHLALLLQPQGRLQGSVVAAETLEPISDAHIFLDDGRILVTDSAGKFTAGGIQRSRLDLAVVKPGRTRRYVHSDTSRLQETRLQIRLAPAGLIAGRVQNTNGEPIRDALVNMGTSGSAIVMECQKVRSDDDGYFVFDGVPLNSVRPRISAAAHGMSEASLWEFAIHDREPFCFHRFVLRSDGSEQQVKSGKRQEVKITDNPLPTRTLSGIVVDEDDKPIAGASVRNGATMYEARNITSTTDADGWFQLSDLPANAVYRVTADAVGYGEVSIDRTFTIPVNEITDDDALELVPGGVRPFHVSVVDGNSKLPISGASVFVNLSPRSDSAVDWSYDLLGLPTLLSNQHGFADSSFPQSGGVVCVQKSGYARASTKWKAGSQSMEIVLDPESRVHVSIQTNNGKPVPGCQVWLTDLIGSRIFAEPTQDGAAEFEIGELTAGAYELTVSFENRELTRLRVTLKQGQTLEVPVTVDESSGER